MDVRLFLRLCPGRGAAFHRHAPARASPLPARTGRGCGSHACGVGRVPRPCVAGWVPPWRQALSFPPSPRLGLAPRLQLVALTPFPPFKPIRLAGAACKRPPLHFSACRGAGGHLARSGHGPGLPPRGWSSGRGSFALVSALVRCVPFVRGAVSRANPACFLPCVPAPVAARAPHTPPRPRLPRAGRAYRACGALLRLAVPPFRRPAASVRRLARCCPPFLASIPKNPIPAFDSRNGVPSGPHP